VLKLLYKFSVLIDVSCEGLVKQSLFSYPIFLFTSVEVLLGVTMNKEKLSELNETLKRINSKVKKTLDTPVPSTDENCPILQSMRDWVNKSTK